MLWISCSHVMDLQSHLVHFLESPWVAVAWCPLQHPDHRIVENFIEETRLKVQMARTRSISRHGCIVLMSVWCDSLKSGL
ncbi:hypothetical protein AVEN_241416-1 [Araneus ventricosus]|uniref:Uncharacterized protein n=1 Tax=Araneus ventricosus TaxID=182803 RepID=A0A4Y2RWF9_ARAVE|nr:hypothetical protein AVEN_241416-1 [Araneus ventricosus]